MTAKTALVVDDSKSARFALRRFLESHQYKVETAESAEHCFSVLRSFRPDLVFLDHVMPGIDGFAALRQIKADPATRDLRVVICSSNEGEEFERQARSNGAIGLLQKPPSVEQLTKLLDSLQTTPAAAPTPAPAPAAAPTPSKVANIREPEVTIEQRVMKTLRDSLATPQQPAPMTAALEQVSQNLSKQIAQLQAQTAQLQSRIEQEREQAKAPVDLSSIPDLSALTSALASQLQRIEALEQLVDEHFHELRLAIDAGMRTQVERIDSLTAIAREAAHEEAERAVMDAAARISDQLAHSILDALRNVAINPLPAQTPEAASPPASTDRRQA